MEEEFVNQSDGNGDPEDKKGRNKVIIAVGVGIVICCCCVGFVYSGWNWWGDILYDMLIP